MIKLKEIEIDPVNLLVQLTQQLQSLTGDYVSFIGILLIISIILIGGWIALQILKKILETLTSVIESLKKLGLSYMSGRDKKLAVRRLQQFCVVLRSDMDSIAKSENWNDQWFTDLEAEVEAEGGYYSSVLSRLLGRRSNGIRRIPSLMQAIQTSTERCMLLVGEPGCGKSVALRHLARNLADQGSKARLDQTIVPLYINLKELPTCDIVELNADYIEKFVLEHVRRGDADTAAYVRDHWQDYKEQGTWFFLFDSFDEIPSVLHAPNGSQAIAFHSRALRQFMDGMGACRGVLASREYKGPEALPWQKLRILPLNRQRQDELIDNTFLNGNQKSLVRQHLALVGTGIFGNPLFLSLLCRYIGENQQGPSNDHDLLIKHIERLALRDPAYIQKKYGVDSTQLLQGATLLAVLFAEQRELSLAPKFDEIFAAFTNQQWKSTVDIENLLAALIDVKIGRSDVKEARPGDRRFTFSHRRYQETLFVHYLANNIDHIATSELLMDSRWREFTVTLIQSQDSEVVKRFAAEATLQIEKLKQIKVSVQTELANDLYYYDWSVGPLLHLLTLLNEGFARRLDHVPDVLRHAISHQLMPRWNTGDLYDKLMVVRHGCLMPIEEYQGVLEWAIISRIDPLRQASFMNAQYLGDLSESMSRWVRCRYADETLVADNKIELYKLDALGNRLPIEIGAPTVFSRCRKLRALFYQPWPLRFLINSLAESVMTFRLLIVPNVTLREKTLTRVGAMYAILFYFLLGISALTYFAVTESSYMFLIVVSSVLSAVLFSLFTRLLMRAEPTPLTPLHLFRCLKRAKLHVKETLIILSVILVMLCLFVILPKLIFSYFGNDIGIIAVFTILSGIMVWGVFNKFQEGRKANKNLNNIIEESADLPVLEYIKLAGSAEELLVWLRGKGEKWLSDNATMRSILRYAEVKFDVLPEAGQEANEARSDIAIRALGAHILVELERESTTTP